MICIRRGATLLDPKGSRVRASLKGKAYLRGDGGHKAGLMPTVRHNMMPGMRAYQVVNRGIQACVEGILGPSLSIVTSKCRTIFVHACAIRREGTHYSWHVTMHS